MKKLLLLLVPVLMLACSKDYTEDINTINGRLDKLEQESIPSVNEQLKLLESAIATLEDVDKDLEQLIDGLENTSSSNTSEINSLKDQDKALDTRVKDLESAKDSLENDVNSLESKAAETLSQLKTTNDSLNALSTTVSTLGTNLGNLDKKIDEAVTSLDNKIKSAVEQLNSKIADLESRLKAVEDKVSELLARIQSVSYIPEYTDGKVLVERMGQSSSGSFSFRISPKDCVPALANVWESALSCEAVYTKTRAASPVKLAVTEFEGDEENGIITVKFSGEGLSEEFFAGTQEAKIALVISDGNSSLTSKYVEMLANVITDEIWYTTADGNVLEPKNVGVDIFGANIVSNTYENGKGVIKFDGPVTMIGSYAFGGKEANDNDNNYMLQTITLPSSVATIANHAFAYICDELVEITIPDSVTSIGRTAFGNLAKLERVTLGKNVESLGLYTFSKCSSLKSINIPEKVTAIPENCFRYCTSLKRIDIHDKITSMGSNAFQDCSGLECVYITDLSAWCRIDFASNYESCPLRYAHNLYLNGELVKHLVIPSDITEIKPYAFFYSNIESVELHNGITSIRQLALGRCNKITSITIPESVENIEEAAFYAMSALEAFYGKFATEDHRALIVNDVFITVAPAGLYFYKIPEGVKTIGTRAFMFCPNLKSLVVPGSVTSVSANALYDPNSMEAVQFLGITPPVVAAKSSFQGYTYPIYVPEEAVDAYKNNPYMDSVAANIRPYDDSMMEITYTTTDGQIVTPYSGEENGFRTIESLFGANILYNTYEGGVGKMVFNGVVVIIGEASFMNCSTLKSFNVPSSVVAIGADAFEGCTNLEQITLPEGLQKIYQEAFHFCDSLKSLTLPSTLTHIAAAAFFNCGLEKVYGPFSTADNESVVINDKLVWVSRWKTGDYVIPDGVKELSYRCIGYPENVITVTIPESVKTLNDSPFIGVYNISAFYGKYATANNREVIHDGHLYGVAAYGLTDYSVPEGVKTIAYRMLRACKFKSVTLPASLQAVAGKLFENCNNMETLYCKATTPPTLGIEAFLGCSKLATIYVPAASVNAYKSADGWKDYATKILGYNF